MEFTISQRQGLREEGERAFLHSNVGLVPESQSFELSGNDENSTGYKLQNQKVKEYESSVSVHLKKNEGGLDRSPYDMESADCMATPKLDFSNSLPDLENDCEARLKEDLAILRFHINSLMKFPISFKRFPSSPNSNPDLEEIDSIENSSVDVYMEKALSKCEAEQVDSYKESNSHVVKDICVKEQVLTKNKVILENSVDGKAPNFFPSDQGYKNKEKQKVQLKDLMYEDEDETEEHFVNVNKKMVLPEEKVLMQELGTQKYVRSKDKGKQVSSEPEIQSLSVYASPTFASEIDESNIDDNGMFWSMMKCQQVGCKCNEIQNTYMAVNEIDEGVISEVRDSIGELSFSALCNVPYSRSISIGSDCSTTSSGSFAFPILQSEWNNNPDNMPEAERKHRGWRQVLLCCRF